MIRWLRYLLLVLLGLSLVTVAAANRAPVTVRLLPEDLAAVFNIPFAAELPLFLVIFAGIIAGLLIGFVWEWLREAKHRSRAASGGREIVRLERELASLRDAKGEVQDDVLALLTPAKR